MAETKVQGSEQPAAPKAVKTAAATEVSEKMRKFSAYVDQESYDHAWCKAAHNVAVPAYVSSILFGKMARGHMPGMTPDSHSFKIDTAANQLLLLLIRIIYKSAITRRLDFDDDLLAKIDAMQGDDQDVPTWRLVAAIIRWRRETWAEAKYFDVSQTVAAISTHYKLDNSEEHGISTAEAVVELVIDSLCSCTISLRHPEITRKGCKSITITSDELIGMLSLCDLPSAHPIAPGYLCDLCWCAHQFPGTMKLWASLNKKAAKAKAPPKSSGTKK